MTRQPFTRCLAAAILLIAGLAGTLRGDERPAGRKSSKKIIVIAHRGAHRHVPENTLASLEEAIKLGVDYVEVDVRRTKDGALVIMHDATVNRMTTGRGRVEDLTLAEIKRFDIKPRRDGKPTGLKVPTFDEILSRAKGHLKIYVDHKKAPPAEVLAKIEAHGMLHNVVVYGSVSVLREYKKLAPSVWIMPDHPASVAAIERLAKDLHPETLDGSVLRWTRDEVNAAHRAGIEVWVDNRSDLDNDEGIEKAVTLGVDAIQTDDPATLLKILARMGRR